MFHVKHNATSGAEKIASFLEEGIDAAEIYCESLTSKSPIMCKPTSEEIKILREILVELKEIKSLIALTGSAKPALRGVHVRYSHPINRCITISERITVKELSEKLDVKANLLIRKIAHWGRLVTLNEILEANLAEKISNEFGAWTMIQYPE